MKSHTTNYFNSFIEVAEDTKATSGTIPPAKAPQSVAGMQYEMLVDSPYRYSSDDVLFSVYARRKQIAQKDYPHARVKFFSKGQACFRASPLTKTYGFGVHSNEEGKIAIYGMETDGYKKFLKDDSVKKIKAMRSAK